MEAKLEPVRCTMDAARQQASRGYMSLDIHFHLLSMVQNSTETTRLKWAPYQCAEFCRFDEIASSVVEAVRKLAFRVTNSTPQQLIPMIPLSLPCRLLPRLVVT